MRIISYRLWFLISIFEKKNTMTILDQDTEDESQIKSHIFFIK